MKNRILIVEDDHAISDAVALNMQFVGYDYMVFDDGAKAAAYLADGSCAEAVREELLESTRTALVTLMPEPAREPEPTPEATPEPTEEPAKENPSVSPAASRHP